MSHANLPDSASPALPPVAKLAAKVAHELNNPLDAVLRFVSLAQRKSKSGDYSDVDRHLADAQYGLQRMAEILRELMDIGRQSNDILARPQPLPLSELIAQALHTIAALAETKHISLLAENGLPANITPRYDLRLSQVLANLLKNAVDAGPEQSTVRLATCLVNSELFITIQDCGPGINADLFPQLFTPFVTTKPRGSGHGLGLAISRELIISLHGSLTLENYLPTGCLATIALPLS
ncbi:MAG TPA: HAMP domain-containing sensor histidine kinase [Phycisphaerae bacterium]